MMVKVAVGPLQEVSGFSQSWAVEPEELAGIAVGKEMTVAVAATVGNPAAVGSDGFRVRAGRGVEEGIEESWGICRR